TATSSGATYSYTADGALSQKSAGGQATQYEYDEAGTLLAVNLPTGERVEYMADATGRRIERLKDGLVTQRWLYGAAASPVAEVDAAGHVLTRYVYGSLPWVPSYLVRSGTTYAIITDSRGSVRLVVDAQTGLVAQQLDYDEYGRVLRDTAPGFQP